MIFFAYFNMIFMVVKAIIFTVEIIVASKKAIDEWAQWIRSTESWGNISLLLEESKIRGSLLFLFAIFINVYPISRAAGAIYQAERGDSIVKVSLTKSVHSLLI